MKEAKELLLLDILLGINRSFDGRSAVLAQQDHLQTVSSIITLIDTSE